MRIVWSSRAENRLQQILDFISEDQPVNAINFVDRLILRGDSLADNAHRGRKVPEYQNENIREVFEQDYRIIYQLRKNEVLILTVRHCREILPGNIQNV